MLEKRFLFGRTV